MNTTWRYQAVYTDHGNGNLEYSICEVYLDEKDMLNNWTESRTIAPSGRDIEELIRDLNLMLKDIDKWKPVPFNELHVGMSFEQK